MGNADVIVILEEIAGLLEAGHEQSFTLLVRNALSSSPQTLGEFVRSNALWGGAGSIADQAFVGRSTQRKELEKLLLKLANFNSEMAIRTFEQNSG